MKKIIAFAGSNHSKSINRKLVSYVVQRLQSVHSRVLDLREFDAPIYSIDLEKSNGIPETICQLKRIIDSADGFIIASPEHNGSLPAFFKNIIDWLSRIDQNIFNDKPTVLLSTSPGVNGGGTNLKHLAELLPHWGTKVIGILSIGRFNDYMVNNNLKLPTKLNCKIDNLLRSLELNDCYQEA